jgi:hypothetical protein
MLRKRHPCRDEAHNLIACPAQKILCAGVVDAIKYHQKELIQHPIEDAVLQVLRMLEIHSDSYFPSQDVKYLGKIRHCTS